MTESYYPKDDYEVIIVDDGSEIDIQKCIDLFNSQLNIQLLKQKNAGPAAARNTGAAVAKGKYLAFIDDDCCLMPDWLNKIEEQLKTTANRIIGGKTINILRNNWYSETSQLIIDIVYENYNADSNNACFFASNNMVVPKKQFLELGGFLPNWRTSEDRELCDRWMFNGHKMTYLPSAVICHAHDLSFWGFCRQHFGYGQGAYQFHKKKKERYASNMQEEIQFHADVTNWLFMPFKTEKGGKAAGMFFLMMVWQAANLCGYVWEYSFRERKD